MVILRKYHGDGLTTLRNPTKAKSDNMFKWVLHVVASIHVACRHTGGREQDHLITEAEKFFTQIRADDFVRESFKDLTQAFADVRASVCRRDVKQRE